VDLPVPDGRIVYVYHLLDGLSHSRDIYQGLEEGLFCSGALNDTKLGSDTKEK
jgi:hypothetical protein